MKVQPVISHDDARKAASTVALFIHQRTGDLLSQILSESGRMTQDSRASYGMRRALATDLSLIQRLINI